MSLKSRACNAATAFQLPASAGARRPRRRAGRMRQRLEVAGPGQQLGGDRPVSVRLVRAIPEIAGSENLHDVFILWVRASKVA